jgi:hypothetical protein
MITIENIRLPIPFMVKLKKSTMGKGSSIRYRDGSSSEAEEPSPCFILGGI